MTNPVWKGDWIGTNTGGVIELLGPRLDQINIEDIATGLSNVCRFGGQVKWWYSVAEHSVHVAELAPNHLKLQALLHDAAEAYIGDIATPLKRMLGDHFGNVESAVANAIGNKFGVDLVRLDPVVKQADAMLLVTERDYLQAKPGDWGPQYENVLRYPNFRRAYTTPDTAKLAFLNAFKQYYKPT